MNILSTHREFTKNFASADDECSFASSCYLPDVPVLIYASDAIIYSTCTDPVKTVKTACSAKVIKIQNLSETETRQIYKYVVNSGIDFSIDILPPSNLLFA